MTRQNEIHKIASQRGAPSSAKKSYQKPEFRFERVFETRALSCGKVSTTQAQCAHNLSSS